MPGDPHRFGLPGRRLGVTKVKPRELAAKLETGARMVEIVSTCERDVRGAGQQRRDG